MDSSASESTAVEPVSHHAPSFNAKTTKPAASASRPARRRAPCSSGSAIGVAATAVTRGRIRNRRREPPRRRARRRGVGGRRGAASRATAAGAGPARTRRPAPRPDRYIAAVKALRTLPPALVTAVPGPRSRALAARLARVESRNVTCLAPEPPIFWERAAAANVWDVDGNRFVDLGAGFGVAAAGHAHPRIAAAVARQAETLLHAMGD